MHSFLGLLMWLYFTFTRHSFLYTTELQQQKFQLNQSSGFDY